MFIFISSLLAVPFASVAVSCFTISGFFLTGFFFPVDIWWLLTH